MEKTDKPVDRETLYNEVWTDPVTVVAPRYGLSDVGLAKICRALAIPLPSRGYWAKVKAGRVMGRAPLPKLKTQVRCQQAWSSCLRKKLLYARQPEIRQPKFAKKRRHCRLRRNHNHQLPTLWFVPQPSV